LAIACPYPHPSTMSRPIFIEELISLCVYRTKEEILKQIIPPLYLLEPVEIIQGVYCELDFDLTYGEVIHDFIG
jgi:hypothetical protein